MTLHSAFSALGTPSQWVVETKVAVRFSFASVTSMTSAVEITCVAALGGCMAV